MKKLFKSSKPQKGHITPLALPDPQDSAQYQQHSHRASESNGAQVRSTQHLAALLPQRDEYDSPPPSNMGRQLPSSTQPAAAQYGANPPSHAFPRVGGHHPGRPSADGLNQGSDENWVMLPTGLQHPQPQPLRTPSNPHVPSLPPGASPPASSPYIPASPANIIHSAPQSAPQSPPATAKKIGGPFSLGTWVTGVAAADKLDTRERSTPEQRERHHLSSAPRSVTGHGAENGYAYPLERSGGELDDQSSLHSVDDRKEKKGLAGFFGGVLDRDKDRERDREREREKERERERERAKEHEKDAQHELIRMIGYLTATQSEDWSLVLEVCERASASETSAREAARALRREFKYAEPPAQLSAARLWAIMIRNCSPTFIGQTQGRKFIDALDDVLTSSRTSPVVRERLLEVLAAAAFHCTPPDDRENPSHSKHGFAVLWRKVKPPGSPDEGIPFNPDDVMFSPPIPRRAASNTLLAPTPVGGLPSSPMPYIIPPNTDTPPPPPIPTDGRGKPRDTPRERTQSHARRTKDKVKDYSRAVIPPEEDIRRLFEECEMATGNAQLLGNSLTYAVTADLLEVNGLIKEFHSKCLASQDLIVAQIPWATAMAERSRQKALESQQNGAPLPMTAEEQLLAALLAANQELLEAFRVYDDLERLALAEKEEREVQERSMVEQRIDRRQVQYITEDGSVMMMEPGGVEASSGPSRSNSPLPPLVSVPLPVPPMLPTTRSYGPLPSTPSPPSTAVSHHTSHPHAHHGSQTGHTLPPPPQAPHGPRKPMPPRSRSPSLERVGTVKGPRDPPSRQGSRENPNAESKDLQVQEITKGVVKASLRQERAPLLPTQGYDSVDILSAPVVVVPSAKALGKRRAAEPPTPMQETVDPHADEFEDHSHLTNSANDDTIDDNDDEKAHNRWNQPIQYCYDAAAEREKERQMGMHRPTRAPEAPRIVNGRSGSVSVR